MESRKDHAKTWGASTSLDVDSFIAELGHRLGSGAGVDAQYSNSNSVTHPRGIGGGNGGVLPATGTQRGCQQNGTKAYSTDFCES